MAVVDRARKDAALEAMAAGLDKTRASLLEVNAQDVAEAKAAGLDEAMIDRRVLNDGRIDAMA